ncbi:MAG: hypothetical protein CK431_07040 [Mycobacterium sp.]|nr:MAG: hypothetical protein CK431_07040 [Mycobacterium sp.]
MMNRDNGLVLAELDPHEKRIRAGETDSIEARWEFGQILLKQRVGKQLPHGMRADIAANFDLEASEITRRMQLAEKFATREEVVDACTRCGSWRRLIAEELTNSPRPRKKNAWVERARAKLDKLMQEAGESDERHNELVALLRAALHTLSDDVTAVTS